AKKFTSLLLPGGQNVLALEPQDIDDVVTIAFPLETELASLDLTASTFGYDNWTVTIIGTLTPTVDVVISGERVTSNLVDVTTASGTALLPMPNTHNGKLPVESVWRGTASGTFGLKV